MAIISTITVSILGLIFIFWSVTESNEDLIRVQESYNQVQSLHGDVMLIDEKLTMSSWVAAATLDEYWGQRYRRHEKILESKLRELMQLSPPHTHSFIQETIDSNEVLVRREESALEAAGRGESKVAIEYLTHPEYAAHKQSYSEGMRQLNLKLQLYFQDQINLERQQIRHRELLTLLVTFVLIIFWIFIYRIASQWQRVIDKYLVTSNEVEASLRENVATHKQLVQERTIEIQTLRHALLQAERQERQRLRRLVHDDLQQLIVALRLKSAMYRDSAITNQARDQYQELVILSNAILTSARDLVVRLSAPEEKQDSLREMISTLAIQFQERYQLTIATNLSKFKEPDQFEVRLLLFRAIRELLFNIVKYAQTDQAQVTLSSEPNQDIVIVSDQGIGFNVEALPVNSQYIQSGLGLLGMREQFTLVGGKVGVSSELGKGTTISLSIPHRHVTHQIDLDSSTLGQKHEQGLEELAKSINPNEMNSFEPQRGYTIFVVDDNQALRQMITQLFRGSPYFEVIGQAASGPEAVKFCAQREVDLILIDYSLPGFDGAETLRKITAIRPNQKALGFTSFDLPEIIQSFEEAGATRVILKGGDPEHLIQSCLKAMTG